MRLWIDLNRVDRTTYVELGFQRGRTWTEKTKALIGAGVAVTAFIYWIVEVLP